MGLEGKTAIVTGGGVGIGKAICMRLAKDGANVAVLDINAENAQKVADEVAATGVKAMPVVADVTDYAQMKDAAAKVKEQLGSIDILVNNAGIDKVMPFVQTDEALWDKIIDVNYKGFLIASHVTIPYMIEQNSGNIISLGSDAGRIGNNNEVLYCGTKAAIMASSKALARELARYKIRVNCVAPGPIAQTELLDGLFDGEHGQKIAKIIPLRRLGVPEDVAAVVSFFASEDSSYLTGQVISIDGGLTMIG